MIRQSNRAFGPDSASRRDDGGATIAVIFDHENVLGSLRVAETREAKPWEKIVFRRLYTPDAWASLEEKVAEMLLRYVEGQGG